MNKVYISTKLAKPLKEKVTPDMKTTVKKAFETCMSKHEIPFPWEVSVEFTDDKHIRKINSEHRGIDRPTDVLSFPNLEFENVGQAVDIELELIGTGRVFLGDVLISIETALRQAEEYGHSISREIGFLTVHSALHLIGYDHMEEAETVRMRAAEEEILAFLGLVR